MRVLWWQDFYSIKDISNFFLFWSIKFITKFERTKYFNKNPQNMGAKESRGGKRAPGKTVQSLKFHSGEGRGLDPQ